MNWRMRVVQLAKLARESPSEGERANAAALVLRLIGEHEGELLPSDADGNKEEPRAPQTAEERRRKKRKKATRSLVDALAKVINRQVDKLEKAASPFLDDLDDD